MTGENVIVQSIFDKNFGNTPYGSGTRKGVPEPSEGRAQPGPGPPALVPPPLGVFPKFLSKIF